MTKTVDTVETKVIEIEARLIEVTSDTGVKNKFYAYKGIQKNGKKIDVRFTTAVTNAPKENCFIKVNIDNMNIDKNRKYPVLWITEIIEIVKPVKRVRSQEEYEEVDSLFNDDLPF